MRIAVTGYRGRLGSELVARGCVPLAVDFLSYTHLAQVIERLQPDVIINCAAMTNVDQCQLEPIKAMSVNFGGVVNLAQWFTGRIVQLSTDYIFDGKAGPYVEDDKPNPQGIYGLTKLAGEVALFGRPDTLIIRTTVLFDRTSRNFVTNVAEQLKNGTELDLPDDLYGSPTYVPHLADAILKAVGNGNFGVINVVGNRLMSRYQLGQAIQSALGLADMVRPTTYNPNGRAPRPLKAGLITNKAKLLGLPIGDPVSVLREIL